MIMLYEHPLSPYAQKVKIALREKELAFESRIPDLFTGGDRDFQAANPRLEVPAMVDDGFPVFDSTIILEYLEDRWPTPPLLPPDPAGRARVRMLEELCDTYYEAINWAVFEIRVFQRATGELADRLLSRAAAQVAGVNAYLDRAIGDSPFFTGERFGWGDLAVVPYVQAAASSGHAPVEGSRLAAWLERVGSRPSLVQTFDEAIHSLGGFQMLPELVRSGQFVREYRDHRLEWMLRSGGVDIVLDGMQRKNIRFSHELV
jgi:glutathione S-transferase/RNA polymerase-associated protein